MSRSFRIHTVAALAVLCAAALFASVARASEMITQNTVPTPGTASSADGPGAGAAAVVAVGDSAISGEAGRWAGNTNGSSSNVDALGPTAYDDNAANTAETTPGCHRSKAAEIWIGGVDSANLACS